jgi:hypothetical protein
VSTLATPGAPPQAGGRAEFFDACLAAPLLKIEQLREDSEGDGARDHHGHRADRDDPELVFRLNVHRGALFPCGPTRLSSRRRPNAGSPMKGPRAPRPLVEKRLQPRGVSRDRSSSLHATKAETCDQGISFRGPPAEGRYNCVLGNRSGPQRRHHLSRSSGLGRASVASSCIGVELRNLRLSGSTSSQPRCALPYAHAILSRDASSSYASLVGSF